jgi:hypothetical protein
LLEKVQVWKNGVMMGIYDYSRFKDVPHRVINEQAIELIANEFTERDKKFIANVASELREKALTLEKLAESGDVSGIWLLTLRLSVLVDHLKNFVDEKRKGGDGE